MLRLGTHRCAGDRTVHRPASGGRVMDERFSVVVPTIGRPSLMTLLRALDEGIGADPDEVVVVDDRPDAAEPLALPPVGLDLRIVRSGGRGPAAARNVGWRAASSPWVAFLDDDVVPSF